MKLFDVLNEDNYILYASRNYDNPQCVSIDEFYDDLSRVKYLKRLFRRYLENDDLQERLILNHLIIFYNVFGIEAANRMMLYKMNSEYLSILKTFLVYLNFIRKGDLIEVPLDENVIRVLRGL